MSTSKHNKCQTGGENQNPFLGTTLEDWFQQNRYRVGGSTVVYSFENSPTFLKYSHLNKGTRVPEALTLDEDDEE